MTPGQRSDWFLGYEFENCIGICSTLSELNPQEWITFDVKEMDNKNNRFLFCKAFITKDPPTQKNETGREEKYAQIIELFLSCVRKSQR